MLIDFSVQNFRSFHEEQTLSLVASKAQKGHSDHRVEIPHSDQHALRTGLIYGANAAGKSNLIRAMRFAQLLIEHGAGPMKRIALDRFRFVEDSTEPSSFEFRFMVEDCVYVYGFEVTAEKVVSEWLTGTVESGREVEIYERSGNETTIGNLKRFGKLGSDSAETLKALVTLGTRPNQLLLNKIVDLDVERQGELLHRVVQWFSECLTIIEPDAPYSSMIELLDEDPAFRNFASHFLSSVGTGIGKLAIDKAEIDADKLPKPIVESLQSFNEVESTPIVVGPGMRLSVKPDDPKKIIRTNLAATHVVDGEKYDLSFSDESDGTQRFLHLLPALYLIQTSTVGRVFVIDELDRSLHPLLSHALLKFFVDVFPGARQQMIVTTHESHLLDRDLLRRDEIWFAEKDEKQQTRLYSLLEMKIRKDLRIEKSYLQGRFGAVPFIGNIDRLKDMAECPTGP